MAGAIYFGSNAPTLDPMGQVQQDPSKIEVKPISSEDHIRGSASAPVVVIEYSDTECPYCKVFHNTMKDVYSSYGNQIAWVYRQLPIPQLHARAIHEAEATECAAELGGNTSFWNYLDKVFATTNSNDSLDPAELPKIAGQIGLNVESFNTCLNSGKYKEKINQSIEEAIEAGAMGTPYSVIISASGEKSVINGAEPLASVKLKIDALLKK